MSTKERKWFVRLGSKKLKEEEAVLHEALKVVHFFPSLYVTLSSFHSLDPQWNLIMSKLLHRDEDVKSKSSSKVEKPLHFVSFATTIGAATVVVAMTSGLANPDDDEGVLTDEDDDDDLEGDADNEMEEEDDDNDDDGNVGGV
ncbi:hypothetical protein ACFX12_037213 [Malus domestica]